MQDKPRTIRQRRSKASPAPPATEKEAHPANPAFEREPAEGGPKEGLKNKGRSAR
jgi:hypothetical protein